MDDSQWVAQAARMAVPSRRTSHRSTSLVDTISKREAQLTQIKLSLPDLQKARLLQQANSTRKIVLGILKLPQKPTVRKKN